MPTINENETEQVANEIRTRLEVAGVVLIIIDPDRAKIGVSLHPQIKIDNVARAVRSMIDEIEKKHVEQAETEQP